MLNNFIYAQTKDLFLEALGAGNILDEAIVFIEDTKEIWNHGHYFAGEHIDPQIISDLQAAVAQMQSNKLDSSTAASTYATKTEVTTTYLPINVANALYAKVSDMQGISNTISGLQTAVSNLQTETTNKANKATTIAGYGITDAYTKTESDARFTMLPITYSELVTLRDNGQLIPGQQYRITDYMTTIIQENTRSANHQFDIIVTADSEITLNEKARAIQHEGDAYFDGVDLKAWEIWYCLDNDTNRFKWANNNETSEELLLATIKPASGVSGSGTYAYSTPISRIGYGGGVYNPEIGVKTMVNSGPPIYITKTDAYTLVIEDASSYLPVNGISVFGYSQVGKGVIYRMIDEFNNDCPYDFKNVMFKHPNDTTTYPDWYYTFTTLVSGVVSDHTLNSSYCYNNVIKRYVELNNIVFINTNAGAICYCNSFGNACYNNSFESTCNNNSFGSNCFNNSFGSWCDNNSFGNDCDNNSFGTYCENNSFGNTCSGNSFKYSSANNTFGNNCYNNTFGNNCSNNSFGNECYSNTFGNTVQYNSFGHNTSLNEIGNDFKHSSFGNNCLNNTFTTTSSASSLRNNIQYVHLDSGVVGMIMYCAGTTLLKNIHVSSGVAGLVNVAVTNSARQINVYHINWGSSAETNAVDYGEWYKHVTTSGNINVYDRHIICDNSSAMTLTLPTGFPGAEFYIHKRSAQSVAITLTTTGSQYISEGHSSKNTETRATSVTMTSLGTSKVIWDPSANEWLRIYMG